MMFGTRMGKPRTLSFMAVALLALITSAAVSIASAQTDQPGTVPTVTGPNDATATTPQATGPNEPVGTPPVAEPTTAVVSPAVPSLDQLQARRKQVAESQELAESAKSSLLDVYDRAIAQLTQAEELAARKAQYSQAAANVPTTLQEIKASLEKLTAAAAPQAPADLTLAAAEQALTQATVALEEARKRAADLENEPKRRAERRARVPEESGAAKQQLEEITDQLAGAIGKAQPSELDRAAIALLQLTQRALQNRIETNTEELRFYDAARDLLTARRDLAARQVAAGERQVAFWQNQVAALQQKAAEAARQEAIQAREATRDAHPAIQDLAKENADLAERQAQMVATFQETTQYAEQIDARLTNLNRDFDTMRNQVEATGRVTDAMGVLLLGKRDTLPSITESRRRIRERPSKISLALYNSMEYDKRRADLTDQTDEMEALEAQFDPSMSEADREAVRKEAATYYQNQREMLRSIANLYTDYYSKLADLDPKEQSFVQTVEDYAEFIDANVLWVRSQRLAPSDLKQTARAFVWLLSPTNWRSVMMALWADLKGNPPIYILIVMAVVGAVVFHSRMHRRIELVSERVRQIQTDSFLWTLEALALTVSLAATWPAFLLLACWRLSANAENDFIIALSTTGLALTPIMFVLSFLHHLSMPRGLAQDHFRLRAEPLAFLRRHLRWLSILIVPMVFVVEVMKAQSTDAEWDSTVGRLFFIAGQVTLAAFFLMTLRPTSPLVETFLKQRRGGWIERLRYIWYSAGVLAPASYAVLAGMGYLYGARHLMAKLVYTLLLILFALVIRGLFVRWLTVAQRRLALLERRKRQAAAEQKAQQSEGESLASKTSESTETKAQPEQTIFDMSQQTRRLIGAVTTVILVVGLWYIWNDVQPALSKLGERQLYQMGDDPITLGAMTTALVVGILTVAIARNAPGLLEIVILRRLPLDRGARFAIITICRYVLVGVGAALAFSEIGIGWSKIQWLVAAMTVGLGFGLQEIFANFISGLIMLFEQPVRVDDIVTVGDVTGKVTSIRIRATTIRKWDQRELIVPNKEFITGHLINWTLSDNTLRRDFAVGIAYGSDIGKAERLLYAIAEADDRVLKDPAPTVLFKGFGDNSLDFELRVYFSGIDNNLPVWHDINCAIDTEFRKAGIEIAFPQRDVHVRSIDLDVPIQMRNPNQ